MCSVIFTNMIQSFPLKLIMLGVQMFSLLLCTFRQVAQARPFMFHTQRYGKNTPGYMKMVAQKLLSAYVCVQLYFTMNCSSSVDKCI